jgi:hypothetical protein
LLTCKAAIVGVSRTKQIAIEVIDALSMDRFVNLIVNISDNRLSYIWDVRGYEVLPGEFSGEEIVVGLPSEG